MRNPEQLARLTLVPELTGAAITDASGAVIDLAGEIDGDTLCAVVAQAVGHIEAATAMLALGTLEDWTASGKKEGLYVNHEDEQMVVALGKATPNPDAVIKKMAAAAKKGS